MSDKQTSIVNSALCFARHYEDFVPFVNKRKEFRDLSISYHWDSYKLLLFTS